MATKLKSHFEPRFGYYCHQDAQECAKFVRKFLVEHEAVTVFANVQYDFVTGENQRKTTHSRQMTYYADRYISSEAAIMEFFEKTTDVSEEAAEASGIRIIGIGDYFFVIAPHGTASLQRNTERHPPAKRGKALVTVLGRDVASFLFCIGSFYVQKESRELKGKTKMHNLFLQAVLSWILRQKLQYMADKDINLSNMAYFHTQMKRFSIAIFGGSGILYYLNNQDNLHLRRDYKKIIKMHWTGKKFDLIKNLHAFLRIKRTNQEFCFFCKKIHAEECGIKNAPGQFKVPIVPREMHKVTGYADFESMVQGEEKEHILSGFSALIVTRNENDEITNYDGLTKNIIQTNNDLMDEFFEVLIKIINKYQKDARMECAPCAAEECNEINTYFFKSYITGAYKNLCSRHLKRSKEHVMIYFHNFKSYDSRYIIKYCFENGLKSSIFTRTANKIDQIRVQQVSKPWVRIEFKDSLAHLLAPLSSIAKTISNWREVPAHLKEAFAKNKGAFPYDWCDSEEKLEGDIPRNKEAWFSVITGKYADYEKAIALYDERKMENFGQYQNFYNKLDTILLMLAFEEYREQCYLTKKVDPAYFFGAPSLALYCAYQSNPAKYIAPSLEIYQLLQKNIRGGVAQVVKRYAKVEQGDYILMLDVNALYSSCMCEKLPVQFKQKFEYFVDVDLNFGSGYCGLYLVDLHYPSDLHDDPIHLTFPLAPHRYNERLCTTFLDKERYLVHEKLLKFYISKGLEMTKCHCTYVFSQDFIMKDFIEENIKTRNMPNQNPVVKNICKTQNNALYGKTCENVWKYKMISVKNIEDEPPPRASMCNYVDDNHVVYAADYDRVLLCKPIQIGFTILEFAKYTIYDFYYKLKSIYGPAVDLLYTDTDSLTLHFKGFKHGHPYKSLLRCETLGPLLDLPFNEEGWLPAKKTLGKFSDDKNYKSALEFVGLRAKCYALKYDDMELLKNKGIRSSATINNEQIRFANYKEVLDEDIRQYAVQYNIEKVRNHYTMRTTKQKKLALNSYDGKHLFLPDKISTIPYGYEGEKYKRWYHNKNNRVE